VRIHSPLAAVTVFHINLSIFLLSTLNLLILSTNQLAKMAPALLLYDGGTASPASASSDSLSRIDQVPALITSRSRRSHRGGNKLRSPLLKRGARGPPLLLEAAEGNWLSVTDENSAWKIFDASGGAAVSNIGHKDQRVYDAIRKQEESGVGYAPSMSFHTEIVEDFADFLLESTEDKLAEVVFYGSGNMTRDPGARNELTITRLRG
jgi:hypothetical protein